MTPAPEIVVGNPSALASDFARRLREISARAPRLALALPGGSVAEAFFPVLAAAPINWGAIDLFWGDERAVPPDDPDSNYALAAKLLLSAPAVAAARVHRMPADAPDLEANPVGVKGVGELGGCGSSAAFANALYNACGVRARKFPVHLSNLLPDLLRA